MAEPGGSTRRLRTIALDGPAAAGKTTIGRLLAAQLGMLCFDTGVLYRALTTAALQADLSPDDEPALIVLLETASIDLLPIEGQPGESRVLVGDQDVSAGLRRPEVDRHVSAVSSHAGVRAALLDTQRRIAAEQAVIMLGRDIGTVVLPEADIKIYMDASAEARARRRFRERLSHGEPVVYSEVLAGMRLRDARDAGRATAPLRAAEDAVIVDTDRCNAAQVASHLAALVARWPDRLTTEGGQLPCEPMSGV